ncbi:MAG: glycosyltransferase, partial [Firmicutes bacterium]|nr:glycosyltransferase [Bacillota bacterium]
IPVRTLFGVYGLARDLWIGRSRIVLNLHHQEGIPIETVLLSYLLANGVPIVSESSDNLANEVPPAWQEAVVWADAPQLAGALQALLVDPPRRRVLAERGVQALARPEESQVLRRVIAQMDADGLFP